MQADNERATKNGGELKAKNTTKNFLKNFSKTS